MELPEGEVIKETDEGGYKYLGVLEAEQMLESEMKDKLQAEYFRRVRLLVRSKLYGGNVIKGMNSWVVSVIRYTAGIIDWTKRELKAIDIRTIKMMTTAGMFHQKGDVDRLYLMRKEGGRGMISVEDCVRMEENNLTRYMIQSKERLFAVISEGMELKESGKEYKKRVIVKRKDKLMKKQVHGKVLGNIEKVVMKQTWQWLQGGYITKSISSVFRTDFGKFLNFKQKKNSHSPVYQYLKICNYKKELYE